MADVDIGWADALAVLCHDDEIDLEDLALIIVDLARPTSLFVSASLIAATAVNLGRRPTPAGLSSPPAKPQSRSTGKLQVTSKSKESHAIRTIIKPE